MSKIKTRRAVKLW